jgi:hypothetical protein
VGNPLELFDTEVKSASWASSDAGSNGWMVSLEGTRSECLCMQRAVMSVEDRQYGGLVPEWQRLGVQGWVDAQPVGTAVSISTLAELEYVEVYVQGRQHCGRREAVGG